MNLSEIKEKIKNNLSVELSEKMEAIVKEKGRIPFEDFSSDEHDAIFKAFQATGLRPMEIAKVFVDEISSNSEARNNEFVKDAEDLIEELIPAIENVIERSDNLLAMFHDLRLNKVGIELYNVCSHYVRSFNKAELNHSECLKELKKEKENAPTIN